MLNMWIHKICTLFACLNLYDIQEQIPIMTMTIKNRYDLKCESVRLLRPFLVAMI